MKKKILIVEDQFVEANNLRIILERAGYHVTGIAYSVAEALDLIEKEPLDMVLLDIFLQGDQTGIDLAITLQRWKVPFVYLSANSDKKVLDAAKATRPFGFLVKPFREKDVLVMLDVATYLAEASRRQFSAGTDTDDDPISSAFMKRIVAESTEMNEVMKNVKIVGPSDTSVLILGEGGTGKEMIAQCIHELSPRRKKGLAVVNCGALPANLAESTLFGHEKGTFTGATERRTGKFEQADGGTIFLDEVGELPLDLQTKFLRVLQEKEIEPIGGRRKKIDVRVLAATNRNLEEGISKGRFRLDLYYRLNVFPLFIPALRDRKEDIPVLAKHFVRQFAKREKKTVTGISDNVIERLTKYEWPGNIRELENIIARAVLLNTGPIITSIQLADTGKETKEVTGKNVLKSILDNERDHILAALSKTNWKIFGMGGAAEMLKINASTLSSRMKKLGIDRKTYKGRNDD